MIRSNVHVDTVDYIDLPRYGGRAGRDPRRAKMPPCTIPFSPTHTVRIHFEGVTFRTNVEAYSRGEAEKLALKNLRYTYWPESRLRSLGPIKKVEITGA